MRVFLFGLYGLGVEALRRLLETNSQVVGLATKFSSDPGTRALLRTAGRRRIPVFTPDSPGEPGFRRAIAGLRPDLIAVAGYHKRIPLEFLDVPEAGAINTHLSLLPEYRGPCPWKWSILRGETRSGVTIHRVTREFDRGEILAQREVPIREEDTGGTLFGRLSVMGAEVLVETILQASGGVLAGRPQDESRASYFSTPTEGDARVCWTLPAHRIRNLVRGLHPRPGAWTRLEGSRLRLLQASIRERSRPAGPGTILDRSGNTFSVATGSGILAVEDWTFDGDPGLLAEGARFEEALVPERAGATPRGDPPAGGNAASA